MYDNTLIKIIEQIYINPGIHKRELSKQLKLSMPSIDYGLKKIKNIVLLQKSGNQFKYFLDYSKEALIPFLYFVEYSRFEKLPLKIKLSIGEFMEELRAKPILAVIFGSYAKGDYTKSSDIDILLVFEKVENSKEIEDLAGRVSMKTNTKLNPVYLDFPSFKESFHNSAKEFFKKLKKDKIILVGIEWWRQLKNEET